MPIDVYDRRFSERDSALKEAMWHEIASWLAPLMSAPVLDIGCDRGHFIRNASGERSASDIRDVGTLLPGVHFVHASGLELADLMPNQYFGTVFLSNYLEHLSSQDQVVAQLDVVRRLLRPGGRVVILQPNIRLVGASYWDFIDHRVALTERSLVEAATLAGFETDTLVVRFLPYTTKGRLPTSALLVRWYLRLPLLWRLFGKQTLYVGLRRESVADGARLAPPGREQLGDEGQ